MTTQFANSVHDFQIAYERQGAGPALLLVHGFNNERTMWQEYGWIAQLQDAFTVITMDLRGCGESTASHQPDHYTLAAHLADVEAVLDACGVDRFCYWGWSFGATIGTHLAVQSDRLQRAVIAGTYFGPIFDAWHDDNLEIAYIAKAKREGRLAELGLVEGKRQFAEAMDLDLFWARRYGAEQWPAVEPAALRCPTLVYTGSNDGRVVEVLREQQAKIEAAGQRLHIFDGFDHMQLVSERATVTPLVTAFFHAAGDQR